jgi:predicted transcriptional regulator YdeE
MSIKDFEAVDVKKTILIGIEAPLTKSQDNNYLIIRNLWKKFNIELKNVKNRDKVNWDKFGITYRKNGNIFYMSSVEKTSEMIAPSTMKEIVINQGKYAKFIHIGPMTEIKATIYNIYKNIVPATGLGIEINKKAGLLNFEKYDYRFEWNNPGSLLEIYLPINT